MFTVYFQCLVFLFSEGVQCHGLPINTFFGNVSEFCVETVRLLQIAAPHLEVCPAPPQRGGAQLHLKTLKLPIACTASKPIVKMFAGTKFALHHLGGAQLHLNVVGH